MRTGWIIDRKDNDTRLHVASTHKKTRSPLFLAMQVLNFQGFRDMHQHHIYNIVQATNGLAATLNFFIHGEYLSLLMVLGRPWPLRLSSDLPVPLQRLRLLSRVILQVVSDLICEC